MWIFTGLFLCGTPLLVFSGWQLNSSRRFRERERHSARFERLALEKLDVIKTALAMGHTDEEVRELDQRLARLIGADKLATILDPKATAAQVNAELAGADLSGELTSTREKAAE